MMRVSIEKVEKAIEESERIGKEKRFIGMFDGGYGGRKG